MLVNVDIVKFPLASYSIGGEEEMNNPYKS